MATCSVQDCHRLVFCRELCRSHYRRLSSGSNKPIRVAKYDHQCSVSSCSDAARLLSMCDKHYRAYMRHGDPTIVKRKNGNVVANKDGYMVVGSKHSSNPYGHRVYEHKLVMEAMLGRELVYGENVHHKNGIRSDNRPENLELWSKSQPPGQRVEDKVQWAIEILALYAPEVLVSEGR